ncbi:MAG: protein translocase subunit SecF [Actinomycetota bacterium]|nr:protein translocase subunit SecF [Actinomycetota bacterium]
MTGDKLASSQAGYNSNGQIVVSMSFTSEGQEQFSEITAENIGRQLAIVLDGEIKSAPVINTAITSDAVIEGITSLEEANDVALVLQTGALPVNLEIEENKTVGPSLGKDALTKGLYAGFIGLILIVIFMIVYYRGLGLISVINLAVYIIIFWGILAGIGAALTLPGIAGIILTIGMAVDANVIIFERIKEELKKGKSARMSINEGFRHGLRTIVDANITTLITAAALYRFGTGPVRGFAVTLSIGVVISMLTSLVFSRSIIYMLAGFRPVASPKFLGMWKKRGEYLILRDTNINFVGKRRIWYFISMAIIVAGIVGMLARGGFNLGIDFLGGSLMEVKFNQEVEVEQIREVMTDIGHSNAILQRTESDQFIIRTTIRDIETKNEILDALDKGIGVERPPLQDRNVMPGFGKLITRMALIAMGISILGILIYVWIRFEFRFGAAAILALFHDVLITLGVYAILHREINTSTIAALLTIIGYSLNDTIVVFDRIRENTVDANKIGYGQMVNESINKTLSRSLNTSFTTLIPVVILLIIGSTALKDFALALTVGIITGTYSSIFIASQFLVTWNNRFPKFKK